MVSPHLSLHLLFSLPDNRVHHSVCQAQRLAGWLWAARLYNPIIRCSQVRPTFSISKCLKRTLMLRLCHMPFSSCCAGWLFIHFALIWEDCNKGYPHDTRRSALAWILIGNVSAGCTVRLYIPQGCLVDCDFVYHSSHWSHIPVVSAWLSVKVEDITCVEVVVLTRSFRSKDDFMIVVLFSFNLVFNTK